MAWVFASLLAIVCALLCIRFRSEIEIVVGIASAKWSQFSMHIESSRPVHWLSKEAVEAAEKIRTKYFKPVFSSEATIVSDSEKLPNILIILADDLGYNDLSGYSIDPNFYQTRYGANTPNINSIGDNGVRFAQSYSGHSTCTPSRTALFTGRYPMRSGVEFTAVPRFFSKFATHKRAPNSPQPIYHLEEEKRVPEVLRNDIVPRNISMIPNMLEPYGYKNYYIGKWDHGFGEHRSPIAHGFHESLAFQMGASRYLNPTDPRIISSKGLPFDAFLNSILSFHIQHNSGPKFQPDEYMTDYLTKEAVSLIHGLAHRKEEQTAAGIASSPWYLHLAYNAPHNPFQALRTDYESEELRHIPEGMPRIYAAMILALDRGVGKVLQALRDTQQVDNTIVIFTSDNGGADYTSLRYINSPFRGWKLTLFEGGLRVPLFVQWPRFIAKGQSDIQHPVSNVDIAPTLLHAVEYASNAKMTEETMALVKDMDGLSLLPYMTEKKKDFQTNYFYEKVQNVADQRVLFWRSGHYKAMRNGHFKLMVSARPDKVWVFNLQEDPRESNNLATSVYNISTRESLDTFCATNQIEPTEDNDNDKRVDVCSLYATLLTEDKHQHTSSWPALAEIPICIDKTSNQTCLYSDEYVIVPN